MSSQGQATNNARPPQRQQNPSTTHNAQTQRSKRPACQGIFTSNRINAAVGFIVLGLAVAGIWAQLRANAIAAQANKITQNQLNIQLWDECLDRPNLSNTSICETTLASGLDEIVVPRTPSPSNWTNRTYDKLIPRSIQSPIGKLTSGSPAPFVKSLDAFSHYKSVPTTLKAIFTNIFVGLIFCQCFYLCGLRDLLTRYRRPHRIRNIGTTTGAYQPLWKRSDQIKISNSDRGQYLLSAQASEDNKVTSLFGITALLLPVVLGASTIGPNSELLNVYELPCLFALGLLMVFLYGSDRFTLLVRKASQQSPRDDESLVSQVHFEEKKTLPEIGLDVLTKALKLKKD